MADATTVVEGKIKFRDGKKWKHRWCVLKKSSPVADQLQVLLYKDLTEYVKNESKPKSLFNLDAFFGLDAGFTYDRESHVLAIICQKNTNLMAFELRENMIQFEIKIRQSMGEEHQFPVTVVKAPSSSRFPKEPIRLIIHDVRFCLIAHIPPKILLSWSIEDLRRFGTREGKFCFEGGTRCGKGSGVFALQSEQAEDIADIVTLASTGKMANCHRKFKNRSSQIDFTSHLITDMSSSPSSSSFHYPPNPDIAARTLPQGPLPVTLNCCHDSQTGSAESEDWSWYKRHSVSVMDHRRIAALREKGFPENREQLTVEIYDVPPSHGRKLDNTRELTSESNYAHPRPDSESTQATTSIITSHLTSPVDSSSAISYGQYGNYKRIVPSEREYANSGPTEQRQTTCYKRQSASAELLDTKLSSLDEMLTKHEQKDSNYSSHEESLQRLKKQESDLQREMVLLDEILQNCVTKNLEVPCDETCDKPLKLPGTPEEAEKTPSQSVMSSLGHDFTIISGNITFSKPIKAEPINKYNSDKLDRTTVLRLNTSMPEGTPISPLFHAKLSSIPPNSRLNAPLPYINLSKYDDESYSHAFLPGSADSVPVSRVSSMQVLHDIRSRNFGLRGHSCSFTSLHTPAAASSLFNISQSAPGGDHLVEQGPADGTLHFSPCSSKAGNRMKDACADQHHEILVVKMDSEAEDRSIYTPHASSIPCASSNIGSDIVSILTSDTRRPQREETSMNTSDIYENLPVQRVDTPPPELPPKGPALLKKLKAAASVNRKYIIPACPSQCIRSSYPYNPDSNRETRTFGYISNHSQRNVVEKEVHKNTDTKEDNYLVMGSPKIRHKESPAQSHLSFESDIKSRTSHCQNFGGLASNDHLGGGYFGGLDCTNDDEIYLDVDANQEFQRDLYISEADLRTPPVSKSSMLVESTYMEMANMSGKKTVCGKTLEMQQTLSKALVRDNMYCISSSVAPTPPPPPRPMSLKVRHNSDSGISPRPDEMSTSSDQREKTTAVKLIKSPTRVYTKIKKTSLGVEPPMPFPNLIEFSKKMSDSRSTYVNTYVDADKNLVPQEMFINRDVPLPEPVKEGFLARFKRRSSRDKNASQTQEKSTASKNRNSVLERSMSEHDSSKSAKEEKSSRLKVGRRRSSSFPNQLSYQESLDNSSASINKQAASSSSSFSSNSSRPKPDQSESSSVRDFSDDSDMSPLLKRGDKMIEQQTLTILQAHRSDHSPVNPYMQIYKSSAKTNMISAESSKTDDEKLIEVIQRKSSPVKPVIYQRSSSLDLKKPKPEPEQLYYLKLPQTAQRQERHLSFEKLIGCSSFDHDIPCTHELVKSPDSAHYSSTDLSNQSFASSSTFILDDEIIPPSLPPKSRPYQGPLSPVIETAPPIPALVEPIYVEMDEFVSNSNVERSREEEKVQSFHHIQSAAEDGDRSSRAMDLTAKAGIFTF